MSSMRTRMVGIIALLAFLIVETSPAAVKPGVKYPAGTKIDTPGTGVEFTIPQGWNGLLPHGGTAFVLGSPKRQAFIFVTVEKESIGQALDAMIQPPPASNGVMLKLTGEIQREGKTLFASYEVAGFDQPVAGYVLKRVRKGNIGVTYVAISSPETATGVQEVVHALSDETSLEKP
jgi:hypothetical protein